MAGTTMNSFTFATQPQLINPSVMNAATIKKENVSEDPPKPATFYRDTSIRRVDDEDTKEGVKLEGIKDTDLGDRGALEIHLKKEEVEEEEQGKEDANTNEPSVDIYINNVVCAFGVRCHLNLRRIGQYGSNVEYRREYGVRWISLSFLFCLMMEIKFDADFVCKSIGKIVSFLSKGFFKFKKIVRSLLNCIYPVIHYV